VKKKLLFGIIIVYLVGCAPMTRFQFYCDDIDTVVFTSGKIAICPFTGEWKVNLSDSMHYRIPGAEQYPMAIANQISKKSQCLTVIPPERVQQLVPDIEIMLFRHRLAFKEKSIVDSLGFELIKKNTGADYLLFIDRIYFKAQKAYVTYTVNTYKTTTVTYQVWDLNKMKFLYRADSDGMGVDVADFMKNMSSKSAVSAVAKEVVKNLPLCEK
jgi:hypothetical protein